MGELYYIKKIEALYGLTKPLCVFFDSVMVMDKDNSLRANRLAMLGEISALFASVADFKKIVIRR